LLSLFLIERSINYYSNGFSTNDQLCFSTVRISLSHDVLDLLWWVGLKGGHVHELFNY